MRNLFIEFLRNMSSTMKKTEVIDVFIPTDTGDGVINEIVLTSDEQDADENDDKVVLMMELEDEVVQQHGITLE